MKVVAHHRQKPLGATPAVTIAALAALSFGTFVISRGEIDVESPASPHARRVLQLDNALGATLEPLDDSAARMFGGASHPDDMVVTSVADHGRASAAGLRVGDVVEQMDGSDLANIDLAISAISTDPTKIIVSRAGRRATLMVPVRDLPSVTREPASMRMSDR